MSRLCFCLIVTLFANSRSEVLTSDDDAGNGNANTTLENLTQNDLKDGEVCDLNSFLNIVCENDRLKFCGPNMKIMSAACIVNGKQGFCNCERNDCVAEKPVCSPGTTKCLIPQMKLPDNLNCHKFSYCNENRDEITLECPGNLIYDPKEEKCMDTAKCNRIVCPKPGNQLQLIPFPQARNYYLLCFQGVGNVRKCPHRNYAVRNNMCQFDCKLQNGSGLFRDTDVQRCRQGYYYSCRRAGTNFTTVEAKCPAEMIFDEDLGLCTKQDTCAKNGTN